MKTAFLYAGQGSQHKGMGEDLYRDFPEFKEVFDQAPVDFDIKEMCFFDPEGKLSKTEYTQPCMVAFACGMTRILERKGIRPAFAAGLSLGEYSALSAAGVWPAEEAIRMTAFRGKAMTKAAEGVEAAMTAVMGLDVKTLEACVEEAKDLGVVSVCNDNCPGQLVIGGEKSAVEKASSIAKERGARRCVPLNVSGPFHTSIMKDAGDALAEYFKDVTFEEERIPVVFNLTGRERAKDETVPFLLEQQVQNGVQMTASINYMLDQGVQRFIEIGPGKALSGFVKRCAKEKGMNDIICISLETSEDVNGLNE